MSKDLLGKTTEKPAKLDPADKGKPIEYTFNEGVTVVFIPPDQVFVSFSVLGLVFNDLFRYIPAYNVGTRVNHESNFEERAISYARSIYPDIRIKRASQVKIALDNSVQVHLFVQKFPNHIGCDWLERKEGLPYAGYHSQDVDIRGYGLGSEGNGFMHSNVKELNKPSSEKKPNLYEGMQSSGADASNPISGKMKKSGEKLFRLKEGKIHLSQKLLDEYFEAVDDETV